MPDDPTPGVDSPRAWIIVVACFIGAFVTFGVTYCFGVFLKPITLEFHSTHAAMSALFSTISAVSFFGAPFTGKIADVYGPRPVVAVGALLMGSGLILAADTHSFALLFLTYGVGLGGAVACTYIPAVSAVGEWFKVRRDIALGLAISGIGCGTLVAAPLSALLIDRYGWRETFRIFGWSGAALLLLCAGLLARPPIVEKKKVDVAVRCRTGAFALLYILLFFSGVAVYVSFVFLPTYASDIGASKVAAAALIGYVGASSVVGRLGLDALAPRFGLIRMYQIAYLALAISFTFWLTATNYAELVVFSLIMGTGYGGIAAMSPAVAAAAFGVEGLGELLGILFTGFGVACLIGPPIAGILLDQFHNERCPVYVAGGAALLCLFFLLPLRTRVEQEEEVTDPLRESLTG
jgi:MFS family permease